MYTKIDITPIEAMIGTKKKITSLSGVSLDLDIRAGVENGVEFASNGHGFPNVNNGLKGRFVGVVNIKTPKVTDPTLVAQLQQLNAQINKQH